MHWPTITSVAGELRLINANVEYATHVYLHVWPDSEWALRLDRLPDSYIGSGKVPGYRHRFNARELARDLIWQAQQHERLGKPASRVHAAPLFAQPGTDDYAPETQRYYTQFYPRGSTRYLNGLGVDVPEQLYHCTRCNAQLQRGQNCPYCARDNVFVMAEPYHEEFSPSYEYSPRANHLPTRWEADVMALPVTPPPAPYAPRRVPVARTRRRTRR